MDTNSLLQYTAPMIELGGMAISAATNKRVQKMVNEQSMRLAEYQYERNLDMWNKTNAYNSPAAQMARLSEAGLNPNLVYGHGTVDNGSASPVRYDTPNLGAYTGADFAGIGRVVSESVKSIAEVAKAKAEARKAEADALKSEEQTTGIGLDNAKKEAERPFWSSNAEVDNSVKKIRKELMEVERYYTEQAHEAVINKDKALADYYTMKAKEVGKYIDNYEVFLDNARADTANKNAQAGLNTAKTTTEGYRQDNLQSSTELNNARTRFTNIQAAIFPEMSAYRMAELQAATAQAFSQVDLNARKGVLTEQQVAKIIEDTLHRQLENKYFTADKIHEYAKSAAKVHQDYLKTGVNLIDAIIPF